MSRGEGLNYSHPEHYSLLSWEKGAAGISYRNQPTEELTAKMIRLAKDSGYRGWYGIESSGREEIKKGTKLLKKYLFNS